MLDMSTVKRLIARTIRHRRDSRAGFSLLEILVVLAIIALIAAVVGPRLFAQLDRSKVTTARLQIRSLEAALETMRIDIGRLPTSAEGLNLLSQADAQSVPGWYGPYLDKGVPPDPWGRPYVYQAPSEAGADADAPANGDQAQRARVLSYGADGTEGGQGVNADITSDQAR